MVELNGGRIGKVVGIRSVVVTRFFGLFKDRDPVFDVELDCNVYPETITVRSESIIGIAQDPHEYPSSDLRIL